MKKAKIVKRLIACVLCAMLICGCTGVLGEQALPPARTATISFDYNRGNTAASNQVAVWVTDKAGALVKTLYVSSFTADGGYTFREDTLPNWVEAAQPADRTSEALDAISSATLSSGFQRFLWDGSNSAGEPVPDGLYTIHVEGTLYWSSIVHATATVELGGEAASPLVESIYTEETTTNRKMLENIQITYTGE